MLFPLAAPVRPVSVYTSSSTVEIIAIAAAVVAGILAPTVAGIFLWKNTGRTIRAEETRQTNALEAERGRLAATLTAEDHRLTLTLEAENHRLRERFSFERGETDRRELRGILDTLAEHLFALDAAVSTTNGVAANLVQSDREDEVVSDYYCKRLDELHAEITKASKVAGDQIARLELRLGPDGQPLVHRATLLRMEAIGVGHYVGNDISDETVEKIAAGRTKISDLRRRFTADTLQFTEARLHRASTE
jgi:hypothetical protein